jgi:peptide deformylase
VILGILQYPDPRLKRVARRVDVVSDDIKKIVDDMFETYYAQENCAALAATQLDLEDPPAITVIDVSANKNEPLCLINPEIIESRDETNEPEGCMSVAVVDAYEKVKRAKTITVRALDREGHMQEFEATGFLAKCIQHEMDHLVGKIFLDHLPSMKRERYANRIKKQLRLIKKEQ